MNFSNSHFTLTDALIAQDTFYFNWNSQLGLGCISQIAKQFLEKYVNKFSTSEGNAVLISEGEFNKVPEGKILFNRLFKKQV